MQRPSGLSVSLYFLPTSGSISSSRNRAYVSPSVSYSTLRLRRGVGLPSAASWRLAVLGREVARADEDADRDRHLLLVDQVVEYGRRVVLDAVLADENAGRLAAVVLGGHVDPVVADRAGEDLALRSTSTS